MKKIFFVFASLIIWMLFLSTLLFLFTIALIIWIITLFFDKKLAVLNWYTSFWGWLMVLINPFWKVKIDKKNKIKKGKSYVMVCNHQSMVDILVLHMLFEHFKWVSKVELFKVPFIGWVMSMNRFVRINRGNKESAVKMINDCLYHLENGSSIMIFPEGTRTEDGELRNFKEGAFKIALQSKKDILPIVLDGTAEAIPKNSFILKQRQTIVVKVLDAIPYSEFQHKSSSELAIELRSIINIALQKIRKKEII